MECRPMGTLPGVTEVMERIHMDAIGPLPETVHGKKHILTFVDALSKYAIAVPLADLKTDKIQWAIMSSVITKHGTPRILYTDKAAQFLSGEFQKMMGMLHIEHQMSPAYHHQANGLVERFNRTIQEMLRMYNNKEGNNWDEHLDMVVFAYNTMKHATTGIAPFEVLHGRKPVLSIDRAIEQPQTKYQEMASMTESVNQRIAKLAGILRTEASEKVKKATVRFKDQYDARNPIRPCKIEKGMKVLVRMGQEGKQERYNGPYVVERVIEPNVKIWTERGLDKVHLNRVKQYVDRSDEASSSSGSRYNFRRPRSAHFR